MFVDYFFVGSCRIKNMYSNQNLFFRGALDLFGAIEQLSNRRNILFLRRNVEKVIKFDWVQF